MGQDCRGWIQRCREDHGFKDGETATVEEPLGEVVVKEEMKTTTMEAASTGRSPRTVEPASTGRSPRTIEERRPAGERKRRPVGERKLQR